jgi:hypothetical protein
MDLMAAVSSGKKLHDFANSSSLGEALAEIQLDAAYQALEKVSEAKDRVSQLWSVVNHLETAEVAAQRAENSLYNYVDAVHSDEARNRRVVIVVLLAIIYKYLGEEKLCMSTLDKLINPPVPTRSKWEQILIKLEPVLYVPWMIIFLIPNVITGNVRLVTRLVTGKSAPPRIRRSQIEIIKQRLERLRP